MIMTRCRNQQNRNDHFCSICGRQMKHNESYWRDAVADIVCDECAEPGPIQQSASMGGCSKLDAPATEHTWIDVPEKE